MENGSVNGSVWEGTDPFLPAEITVKIMEYLDVQTFKNMMLCCHTFKESPPINLINKNKIASLCNYKSYPEFYNDIYLWETNSSILGRCRVGLSLNKYLETIINNIRKENIKTTQLLIDYFPYNSNIFNEKSGYRYLVHELMLTIYKLHLKCLKGVSELSFKRLITKHGHKKMN